MRPLLPALADPVASVRSTAAQALGTVASYAVRSGTEAETVRAVVQGLFGVLKDPDASVRMEAAGALVTLAEVASGNSRGTGGRGKAKAAKSSGAAPSMIDQKAVVAALLDLLGDPDTEVRRAALLGVGNVAARWPAIRPRRSSRRWTTSRPSSARRRSSRWSAFRAAWIRSSRYCFVTWSTMSRWCRAACMHGLGRIRPSALTPAVIPLLIARARKSRAGRAAALGLAHRQDVARSRLAVPALIAVLREPYESDQQRMAGQMMTISYVGPAQEAAQALGRIAPGTPAAGQAISALAEVVRSGPPRRRAAAAKALAQFGPAAAEAVTGLIAFLRRSRSQQADERRCVIGRPSPWDGSPRVPPAPTRRWPLFRPCSSLTRPRPARPRSERSDLSGRRRPSTRAVIPTLRELNEKDPVPNIRQAAATALEALKAGSE